MLTNQNCEVNISNKIQKSWVLNNYKYLYSQIYLIDNPRGIFNIKDIL